MSTADRQRRAQLAAEYAKRKRHHGPRAVVAQQLKKLTTRLLRTEVADAKAAERRQSRTGTLAGDLDLFLNR